MCYELQNAQQINEYTEYVGYVCLCAISKSFSVLASVFIYRMFVFTQVAGKSFVGWEKLDMQLGIFNKFT